jgi:hypothetical protein
MFCEGCEPPLCEIRPDDCSDFMQSVRPRGRSKTLPALAGPSHQLTRPTCCWLWRKQQSGSREHRQPAGHFGTTTIPLSRRNPHLPRRPRLKLTGKPVGVMAPDDVPSVVEVRW